MKTLLLALGMILGKSFGDTTTEDQLVAAVKTAFGEKDAKVADLEAQLEGLKTEAALGKKYMDTQVGEYVRLKALLKECDETEEGKKTLSGFAKSMGDNFLEQEVKQLTQRIGEKFPDSSQLNGSEGHKASDDKNPLVVG